MLFAPEAAHPCELMENSIFVALLNPSIAFVFAAAFLGLWLYDKRRRYIAAIAAGYAINATGFLMQYVTFPVMAELGKLASTSLFIVGTLCIACGIINRYRRPQPVIALSLLVAAGMAAFCWFLFAAPDLVGRILTINFTLGGIALLVAAELRAVVRKTPIEWTMLVLSLLSAINFMVRTLIAAVLHGIETGGDVHNSIYWTTAMLSHAVLSVTIALTLIASVMLDLISELRSESLTDPLSGLLNRRGFEERATRLLGDMKRKGLPVSLVICDIDHFKAINDGFGHACGDRVIATAGRFLGKVASTYSAAGRIGGEEFAIFLPGVNMPAARLLAEGARGAFPSLSVDGLPRDHRPTASFGVAELSGDDSLADLMARADAALYVAKKDGRDCVRMARPSFTRPAQQGAAVLGF